MRNVTLPIMLAASLAMAAPARAQTDLGDVVSGIAQQLIAKEADKRAYLQAQQQNTANGYRSYLAQYPNGVYRENARRALVKLGAVEDPAPKPPVGGGQSAASVEASLGLSRSQRVLIQKQLTSVGYPTGVADGLWGAKTRDAIGSWQRKNKQSVTGYVTARQVNLLAQQAGSVAGPGPGEPSAGNDALEESLLNLSYAERREVQRRLTTLGYNTYGVDGGFGTNTRRAMAAWQRDEGLRASGYLTADQLRSLRQQTGG